MKVVTFLTGKNLQEKHTKQIEDFEKNFPNDKLTVIHFDENYMDEKDFDSKLCQTLITKLATPGAVTFRPLELNEKEKQILNKVATLTGPTYKQYDITSCHPIARFSDVYRYVIIKTLIELGWEKFLFAEADAIGEIKNIKYESLSEGISASSPTESGVICVNFENIEAKEHCHWKYLIEALKKLYEYPQFWETGNASQLFIGSGTTCGLGFKHVDSDDAMKAMFKHNKWRNMQSTNKG
eukprot:TRINITY_DN10472_c0_g1_i1.p1 TRINITY_DN10472_c0_g1~~TRINITY_DN10472_c0_g1_i1.p1  ORF type:complete len:264 (-),score=37.78 TRINITY_DN10472_c0_g1_i1:217-933(-)